jgi:tRNA (guanine37-N1)-methyltransferase
MVSMNFHIITIFPHIFDSYFNESIIKRAQDKKKIGINVYDLRDWTNDKHRSVDDSPFGGGEGMVMKVGPIYRAIRDIKKKTGKKRKIALLSARGEKWTQDRAREYASLKDVILVCGRYEDVDHRVANFIDEEISIGEYVLTGGEIPAMAVVDSVTRLLPGVLGNEDSGVADSHSRPGYLKYPQYTRPQVFKAGNKKYAVPDVLVSGDHEKVEKWRRENSKFKKDK